jgi:hypothetical protein
MVNRSTLSKGQLPAPPGLAPSPKSDDCSPSLPGSSGNGALANVAFDQDLRNNVPSVFRQSPEDSERRSSPAIGSLRGQACSHEHKS